ncbi:hypothetical protein C6990_05845 [Nitrosopumilus sp. b3]|uniref:hypothetical protein n=1 Tax=Nitrosopumilus sp. b3 TaxID=2109909 RepID=UPI0015F451B3|nr:hypothetical protein [Nitrosopumilus sp. b3]KAF6247194.1 hypothetical protein C6990_05845 [Nitrosopumilus sp. b3]
MANWKILVIAGFAINFLIPLTLWTSGDYEGKIIQIPQHVESQPVTLAPKDSIELVYYLDSGQILGFGFIGTADRVTQQMFAAGRVDLQITNHNGLDNGLEKIMPTECEYPTTIGTGLGCFRTTVPSNYTFTLTNNSPFDLTIPAVQFGKLDGVLVTEFDDTMDDGDILPMFAYEILVIVSAVLIVTGFLLRYYRK